MWLRSSMGYTFVQRQLELTPGDNGGPRCLRCGEAGRSAAAFSADLAAFLTRWLCPSNSRMMARWTRPSMAILRGSPLAAAFRSPAARPTCLEATGDQPHSLFLSRSPRSITWYSAPTYSTRPLLGLLPLNKTGSKCRYVRTDPMLPFNKMAGA